MTRQDTHDSPDQDALLASRLEVLLEQAGELIEQLETISEQQRHAIESAQVSQIVEVVANRDPLVQSMLRVGEELRTYIEDERVRSVVGVSVMENALHRVASFEHKMKHLRERDARDQELMERTRDALARQLSGMNSGTSALRAYSTRSQSPNPTMQDKRG